MGFLASFLFFRKISADFNCQLVGIAKEKKVAISLVVIFTDLQSTGSLKKLRILAPHRKAVRILLI